MNLTITGHGSSWRAPRGLFSLWLMTMSSGFNEGSNSMMPFVNACTPSVVSSYCSLIPEMRRELRRPYCSSASISRRSWLTSPRISAIVHNSGQEQLWMTWPLLGVHWHCHMFVGFTHHLYQHTLNLWIFQSLNEGQLKHDIFIFNIALFHRCFASSPPLSSRPSCHGHAQ